MGDGVRRSGRLRERRRKVEWRGEGGWREEGEKRGWYTVLIPKSGCVVPESTWPVDRLRLFQCFLDLAPSNQSRRKKGNLPRVGSWETVCDQYPLPLSLSA